MLLATLEATADGILVVDRSGKIARYNKRFATMWRLPDTVLEGGDDDRAIAIALRQLKNPDAFLSKVRELYADPHAESFDVLYLIDGRVFERYSIPQFVEGTPVGRVWSFRDVTARHAAEEALKQSRATLAEAQQIAHLGSWSMDFTNNEVRWSEEIYRIYGLTEGVDKPVPFAQFDHPDDAAAVRRATEDSKRLRKPFNIDHRIVRRDSTIRWVQERGDFFFDRKGQPIRSVGTMIDITERKEAEQQLARHAHYDSLTELPNRTLLADRTNQAIAYSDRHKRPTAVLFLDLDRFKNVNDTLGHSIGDALLKAVAGRLKRSVRAVDCVARLSGDEFIIVLTDLPNSQAAMKIAQKIVNETSRSYVVSGHELFTTASIGISMYPADGHDVETLLRNADTAMYQAKERGGNNFQFFAPEMHAVAVRRLSLENELRNALRREEFLLHYQPIASLRTGEIVGAEALLRWRHPALGLRLPDEFTSIAEDAGLIVPIGAWAVRAACEQMKNWQRQGIAPRRITVNISPRQFAEPHFIKMIAGVLRATRVDPTCLEIELTETGIMADVKRSVRIMHQLASMGVRTSIDDFGTGTSSLAYLKSLPVASLKIDRQFIRQIESDSFDASIVSAMMTVAHNRRLQVVAVGVETHAQREALRRMGCDEMQGHLLTAPLPASELQRLLEEKPEKPAAQIDAV